MHRPFLALILRLGIVTVASVSPLASQTGSTDWNRFRGPNGTGLATDGSYPAEIGPEQGIIWKREFPPGHSSPTFSATLLFITAVEDEKLFTYALDRNTGDTVWRRECPRPRQTRFHSKNGSAAASAAVDENTVVVFFDEFGMLAYDHAGKELWRRPMGPFDNRYGMAASPVIVDGVVVMPCDQQGGSFVLGVAKRTGEELWRVDRPAAVSGHCTPVIYEPPEGNKQFILPGSFLLDSYDVKTGERVWWINGLASEMKSVPVLIGDTLWIHGFGTPQNNRGGQFDLPDFELAVKEMDKDGDGLLGRSEMADERLRRAFSSEDLDRSGTLDEREWELSRASFASVNSAMAVKVGGQGDMSANILWQYYRSIPQLPSPLIFDGDYYLLADSGGLLSTISADTGELVERGRLEKAVDTYFASPVAGDGKVYILSESGILSVLGQGKGLEPIHTAEFGELCYATPALLDDSVWLRTHGHLYRFGER